MILIIIFSSHIIGRKVSMSARVKKFGCRGNNNQYFTKNTYVVGYYNGTNNGEKRIIIVIE